MGQLRDTFQESRKAAKVMRFLPVGTASCLLPEARLEGGTREGLNNIYPFYLRDV